MLEQDTVTEDFKYPGFHSPQSVYSSAYGSPSNDYGSSSGSYGSPSSSYGGYGSPSSSYSYSSPSSYRNS